VNNYPLTLLLLLVACLAIFSCAPKKPAIERNHYILEVLREQPARQESIPAALAVRDFSVSPGYQGREIIYKTNQSIARADFYNHYFVLPGPMAAQLTRSWIRDSGLFASVIPMSSHKVADYVLEGAISSIYGDIRDPDHPSGVVEINFLLLKNSGFDFEIVFQKRYKAGTRMLGHGTQFLIDALNRSLKDILTSLEQDMASALNSS
jgi:cholesterol transport system auxiliary component